MSSVTQNQGEITEQRIGGGLVQKNDATQRKEEEKERRRESEGGLLVLSCLLLASPSPYLSGGKMFLPMGAFQTVLRPCDATRQEPMGPTETEITALHALTTRQAISFKY